MFLRDFSRGRTGTGPDRSRYYRSTGTGAGPGPGAGTTGGVVKRANKGLSRRASPSDIYIPIGSDVSCFVFVCVLGVSK